MASGRRHEDFKFTVGIVAEMLEHVVPETCEIFEELNKEYMKVRGHVCPTQST